MASAGWVCVDGPTETTLARCTLDALPALSTSILPLRVSIDESFDRSDGEIGLRVLGAGIDYVAPPIRVVIAASPARLRCAACPPRSRWSTDGRGSWTCPVANVGGTGLARRCRRRVRAPADGRHGRRRARLDVDLHRARAALTATRAPSLPALTPRSRCCLTAAPTGVPTSGLLVVELAPSGRLSRRRSPCRSPPAARRPGDLRPERCDRRRRIARDRAAERLEHRRPARRGRHRDAQPARGRRLRVARRSSRRPGPAPRARRRPSSAPPGVIDAGATLDLPVSLAGRHRVVPGAVGR